MPAPAGSVWIVSVWIAPQSGHPLNDELIVLSLGYEPPNGPKDFTVCLTLVNAIRVFYDNEVGELDCWPLEFTDTWKRIA